MNVTDDEIDEFMESVCVLQSFLYREGLNFSEHERRSALRSSIIHLYNHINEFRIKPKSIDAYKTTSWLGYELALVCPDRRGVIVKALIRSLNLMFRQEKGDSYFSTNETDYLEQLVLNEMNDYSDFGIGRNGLFAIFHFSRSIKKKEQLPEAPRPE